MNDVSLPKKLRELRVAARMTQAELADAAKVSRKTISVIESGDGEYGNTSLSVLWRVMDVLGVKINLVPSMPPTLDDLLRANLSAFNDVDGAYPCVPSRVRKTAAEQELNMA